MDPLTNSGGVGSKLRVPPVGPPMGSFGAEPFSGLHGLAENQLTQVVQSKTRRPAYMGKHHIPRFWGLFVYATPRGWIPSLTPCKIMICSINTSPNEFLVVTP